MWLRRKNSEFGYILIYLFSSLFLLLVLSQFFIAILVAAWESAGRIKAEELRVARLPAGFTWRQDERPWYMRAGSACFLALTGFSWEAGASASAIKHALRHCVSTLEFKIKKRKAEADNTYAPKPLTNDEANEMFLFDHACRCRPQTLVGLADKERRVSV